MLRSVFAPYGKIPGAWPTGITQSYGGNGTFLKPYDAQYNQRGEVGYYHDTPLGENLTWRQKMQIKRFYKNAAKAAKARRSSSPFLGAIPTDFELAATQNYTPVASGWIATQEGYLTEPWLPPNGYLPAGWQSPVQPNDGGGQAVNPMSLRFYDPNVNGNSPDWNTPFNGLKGLRDGTPATVEDVVAEMNRHNDRVFAMTLISTTAVAVSSIIAIFRTLRLIKTGE